MSVLTLYQYNDLDELEQFEVIWNSGILLAKRTDQTYTYTLYSLWNFYVEMKRHIEYDVWHGLRTFSTTALLDPYLKDIDISSTNPSSAS